MDSKTITKLKKKTMFSREAIEKIIKDELNKEREFKYSEDLNGNNYLKPNKAIVKKAVNALIGSYIKAIVQKNSYSRVFINNIRYYTYTKIVKGAVFKYQFAYWLHEKNRGEDQLSFEGNRFEFIMSYDYKRMRGLLNEAYVFVTMGGYIYRSTYDNMIHWYSYDPKYKNGKQEGGFKWHALTEESKNYKNLKINDYFYLNNALTEEHVTQRILGLNKTHVEMLYKLGFKNLYFYRISDAKIEFLKRNIKVIDRDITPKELSKTYTLVKKGMKINAYKEFFNFLNTKINLYRFDYNHVKRGLNSYDNTFLTKTEDTKKIIRMINIAKEHGMKHLESLKGSCFMLDLEFEEIIFKSLKARNSIIKEWKDGYDEYQRSLKRERDRYAREQKKKEKLAKISFDEFVLNNEIIFEKIEDRTNDYKIKEINGLKINKDINVLYTNIAFFYEQERESSDFIQKNEIVIEEKRNSLTLVSLNGEKVDKYLRSRDKVEIFEKCQSFLREKELKKISLEDVTEKFKKIISKNFILEPLRTMKDLNDVSDKMLLCLINNNYADDIKRQKSILYIAYHKEAKERYEGEVILFLLDKHEMMVSQIHGYHNESTKYYQEIKQIAKSLKYNDLIQQQN